MVIQSKLGRIAGGWLVAAVAVAGLALGLAPQAWAQSLGGAAVTPAAATTNSIYNHSVVWTFGSPANRYPWYFRFYTLSGTADGKGGEVTRVAGSSNQVDVRIPDLLGVDPHWEFDTVAGQSLPGVDQGRKVGGERIRITLPAPITVTGALTARVCAGGNRVVEANIPVDASGDGRTFYTRSAPIAGVAGVFGTDGTDYWEVTDATGNPTGETGTFSTYAGKIVLPRQLPSHVTSVKLVYWLGPVIETYMGGTYSDSEGNSVPVCAGLWNDPFHAPVDGTIYEVSVSKGLNLLNDPRGVPGVTRVMTPWETEHWLTYYIKSNDGGGPAIISDETNPRNGKWDVSPYPTTGTYIGVAATVYSPNTNSQFNYPTKVEKVGPVSSTTLKLTPPNTGTLTEVTGVWLDQDLNNDGVPDLTGVNYYNGGTFDAATGIVTLGTALPAGATAVRVEYAYTGNARYGGIGHEDPIRSYGLDRLSASPAAPFTNRYAVYDPLIAEANPRDAYWRVDPISGQVVVNTNARNYLTVTDDATWIDTTANQAARLFTPFRQESPDDGNSSNTFSFRCRYYSILNQAPNAWLPEADGMGSPSGVQLYVKTDGASNYRVYSMTPESAANRLKYDRNEGGYPGDWGVGYLFRMEPNAGFSGGIVGGTDPAEPPFATPNNYIALPVGRHSYFFGTSDDSIRDRRGNLWQNPTVTVALPDWLQYPVPEQPDYYQLPFWTEPTPPAYRPGELSGEQFGESRNTFSYVDRTSLEPGPVTAEEPNRSGYPYSAEEHPVVQALLSGIPFGPLATGHEGGMYFLGTVQPCNMGYNPVYYPPSTGQTAVGASWTMSRQQTAFGTTATKFTFQVMWQSFDPDTRIGRAPKYIKVFVNNKSTAKPTKDDNTTIDDAAKYTGYTLSPVKANPTADDYKNGLTYQRVLSLPAGPHTYYFEADAGFGPVRFPVRPDGRKLEAPAADSSARYDNPGTTWWTDPYVPGEADFADNNDYCPGPYVNNKLTLSDASVTPSSGPYGSDFVYRVTYKDPDGQRPYRSDILIETAAGNIVRAQMQKVDPTASNYVTGVQYQFKASTLQGTVLAPGTRRFRFEFTDDWGHPDITEEKVEGETVNLPQSVNDVVQWFDGPTVAALQRPVLSAGAVTSSDGTSNASTVWTYQVTYAQGNNKAPSYLNVYIGARRSAGDPLNTQTLQDTKPVDARTLRLASLPVLSISGVWANPQGTGQNYYTGGSFNANTGVVTLGTALPEPGRDVWVTYDSNPIVWDAGHRMTQRDTTDTLYTDGAVFQYQSTLPGAQRTGDQPISYYYTFQASDGTFVTRFDQASSPSAYALTRQASGEGVTDTGEFLDYASSGGGSLYTAGHAAIVGPLPAESLTDTGLLLEPKVWKTAQGEETAIQLIREFTAVLDSGATGSGVSVDPGGFQISVSPAVVHSVLGVYTNSALTGTDYYGGDPAHPSAYNATTGTISLGTKLPDGVRRVFIKFYNRGDYRVDFTSGKILFWQPNLSTDTLEMEYWWAMPGPTAVGLNTPPVLTQGQFTPHSTTSPVDGTSTTQFTFSVVYTDTDGLTGQAPQFIRTVIDGVPHQMTAQGTSPVYKNGVTYTYVTTLSSGSHQYYFEASDGSGYAAFDNGGSKSSTLQITELVPMQGPVINDPPTLSGGVVTPNPAGGISPGTPVTYSVTYTDPDGDAPNLGYPKVWVDNAAEANWSGEITAVSGQEITVGGASWTAGALAGKLVQITTGLVPGTGTGSAASGKIYTVLANTGDTLTIAADSAAGEGIVVGDSLAVGVLVMTKQDATQTDYKQPVGYQAVVLSMPIGSHTFHFTAVAPPLNATVRTPAVGESSGPVVNNQPPVGNRAPVLTGGVVNPASGLSSTPFVFQVSYSDADGDAAASHNGVFGYVKLVFDDGSVPATLMTPVGGPVASWINPVAHSVTLTDVPAGSHKFHFEASDGYRAGSLVTRFPAAAANDPSISVNARPVLSIGYGQGVSPANGTPDTTFMWRVTYTDADNNPGSVFVSIDGGAPVAMSREAGTNYAAGVTYSYSAKLAIGSHNYRFTASDGQQDAVPSALQSGPIVQNLVGPELKEGLVTPDSGRASTPFTFKVKYRDASAQPPTSISVLVDSDSPRAMTRDTTYTDPDGWMLYQSSPAMLSGGTHQYHFEASNGQVVSRLPSNGWFTGPSVTGASLTLTVAPASANLGDSIQATGTLAPSAIGTAQIVVSAVKPDLTSVTKTVNTSGSGAFSADLGVADVSGNWTVSASWAGGSGYEAVNTSKTLPVGGLPISVVANRVDMIGLTLIPTSTDPAVVFGSDAAAQRLRMAMWSPSLARYLMYPTDSVALAGGNGFWVRPAYTETVMAQGRLWPQDTPFSIALTAGWNQFGSVFVNPVSLANAQVRYQGQVKSLTNATDWIRTYVWGYNPANAQYFLVQPGTSVSTLEAGRGYWIRALVDCELILRP